MSAIVDSEIFPDMDFPDTTHYSATDIQDILAQYADAFFSDGDLRSESDEDLSRVAQNMLDDLNTSVTVCASTTVLVVGSESAVLRSSTILKCAYYRCFESSTNITHSPYTSALVHGEIYNYCSAPCMRRDLQSYNDFNNVIPRTHAPVVQKYVPHMGFSTAWTSDAFIKLRQPQR